MIEPQELRIGNWVSRPDVPEPFQVNAYGIMTASREKDRFHPVPLTEEWLVRFGFHKWESPIAPSYSKSISVSGYLKEIVVFISSGNEYIHLREGEGCMPSTTDQVMNLLNGDFHGRPFYVHRLQNLFYALTGDELTPVSSPQLGQPVDSPA